MLIFILQVVIKVILERWIRGSVTAANYNLLASLIAVLVSILKFTVRLCLLLNQAILQLEILLAKLHKNFDSLVVTADHLSVCVCVSVFLYLQPSED